jgi:glycosyltransferase A (GT-A) superfamily protein (DUF2064 family)
LDEAAVIAEAALADTLAAVAACHADRRIVALDGAPGPWLPTGFEVIAQRGDGLAERLANAWEDAGGAGIQIGMDTPQVGPAELDRLSALVRPGRAVLGPAVDGGWWVIGLDGVDPHAVFDGVPMSTAVTGRRQLQRLRALGLTVREAPPRRDIDTAADLDAVCRGAPGLRTSQAWAALQSAQRVA